MKKNKLPARLDRLDRYKAHLVRGMELEPQELEMLARYRKASSLMSMGYARPHVVKAMVQEYDISESHAYLLIRDSVRLYGDASQVDRDGMRHLLFDNLQVAAGLARKKEDYSTMVRAIETAAKLFNLFAPDVAANDPSKFQLPKQMVFTDDPEALREAKEQEQAEWEAEDADFEELGDE